MRKILRLLLSAAAAAVNLAVGSCRSSVSAVFQLSTIAVHSGGGMEVRRDGGGYGASGIDMVVLVEGVGGCDVGGKLVK